MGERKGQNKYYPPDYNPNKGGLNKFLGTHALRERARKIHLGIIIIRFEMPYNIWCEGCNNHIGMGVRYNAEKTKVGMYYSTPVYQFKMKCHLCDNYIEMKTDPGNLDYLIVSGARRQENRWDPLQNEQVVPEKKETSRRMADDAMFKLEHETQDQSAAQAAAPRLKQLMNRAEDVWKDDYGANCALRADFRAKRKDLKRKSEEDAALLVRSSLQMELLAETEEDRRMAKLMKLTPKESGAERLLRTVKKIEEKPILESTVKDGKVFKKLEEKASGLKPISLGIRRSGDKKVKEEPKEEDEGGPSGVTDGPSGSGLGGLVAYGSSSDSSSD
ncbi:coiled-coil domain-containing protein 130 homolog [Neocloeon triangulifer]|uniref:coiled-coil domain-containing protein 130 homolog n=1 Tax=Neocloeon triangulifer TaxID=2078957 RepID=UPI00286F5AC7|nr:coiled-coil domain-containing protein 130 homolog [Neocloeon triangulifer]XP_059477436.1 coiled-coil domain-containing protein 130 homolog [Neocloeon triangulifer]